jgi:hypothetical protein
MPPVVRPWSIPHPIADLTSFREAEFPGFYAVGWTERVLVESYLVSQLKCILVVLLTVLLTCARCPARVLHHRLLRIDLLCSSQLRSRRQGKLRRQTVDSNDVLHLRDRDHLLEKMSGVVIGVVNGCDNDPPHNHRGLQQKSRMGNQPHR